VFCLLAENDAALVQKNVASKNHNICYEARLVSMQGERLSKPKKVFCYVSPKQLTIKEFVLKFIPKRLVTFRLCPSTKVSAWIAVISGTKCTFTSSPLILSITQHVFILDVFDATQHLQLIHSFIDTEVSKWAVVIVTSLLTDIAFYI
jgi:hypothetical protein